MSVSDEAVRGGVQELGHVVLYVRDLDRSVEFYRSVLGWQQLAAPANLGRLPIAMFSGGRTHHELLLIEVGDGAAPIPVGRRIGMYHFGLKVGDSDDELRAALARLHDADVQVMGATDHGVTHSLYLADPDGNEIELFIDVPGVEWSFETIAAAPRPLNL